MTQMQVGEKYLTIKLLGEKGISVTAFPNKKVTGKEPDFKGDGVAVWVNVKKQQGLPKDEKVL